jgi:acetylornithine deacetylase/succinyl-diaminopimelate desuccinylase-like protein
VINDKAQLCAFMIAARAIKRASIRLRGDLTITAVAFETGAPSIDEHQGVNYPGEGFGTKWVVDRGVTADYALVGETSGFGIVRAECGAVWLKVRVKGKEVYTPRFERGASIQENPNAFAKAAHVILALEEWAVRYQQKEKLEFEGGAIVPKAQIMNIRGNNEISQASPFCDIYMDIRLVPGKKPEAVKKDVERAVRALGIECEVSAFQYSRGHIAENAEALISALTDAHRYVFGTEPPLPPSAEVSMWRDLNVFNEVGIPSVCYGPPRQRDPFSGAGNRAMKISDLVAATKVYALTALLVCGIDQT